MSKLVIVIPAQEFTFDLDDYKEDFFVDGEWDWDGLYDGFVHESVTGCEHSWEVVE